MLEDLGSDFLVDVRGSTLLSLSGNVTFDVLGVLGSRSTFCGMPIFIKNGSACRRATFGGLISVTTAVRKRPVMYGLTAAHPATLTTPQAAEDDSDLEGGKSSQSLVDTRPTTPTARHCFVTVGKKTNLGTVTKSGLFKRGDLALIKLEGVDPLPNRISYAQLAKGGALLSTSYTNLPSPPPEVPGINLFVRSSRDCFFEGRSAALLSSRGIQHG